MSTMYLCAKVTNLSMSGMSKVLHLATETGRTALLTLPPYADVSVRNIAVGWRVCLDKTELAIIPRGLLIVVAWDGKAAPIPVRFGVSEEDIRLLTELLLDPPEKTIDLLRRLIRQVIHQLKTFKTFKNFT